MENHAHFLKLLDFTPAEIQQFLDTAADLKAKKKAGIPHPSLPKPCPASSIRAREGAGCGSVGVVSGA